MEVDERLGRRRTVSFNAREIDNKDDDESAVDERRQRSRPSSTSKELSHCLEELFKKKGSARENALHTFVKVFESAVHYEYAAKNFVTLAHRCQNCLKRGSALEIDLALRFIGLLVITLGAGDDAHEIYEESLVFLPQVLKSKLSLSIKVIECLAIVTLVAARDFEDTERAMEIVWEFMNHESKSKVTIHPPSVTAAAISAWSMLLSNIKGWRIGHKKWKGLIPYLLKQLEEDDQDVKAASIEALAIIFENGCLEKFSNQAEEYASIKDMKDDIMKLVKIAWNDTAEDASKLLEDDYKKENTLTVCGNKLTFSTWAQLKQINYLKRFLGAAFTNHMMQNEHLHRVFHFVPAKKCNNIELYKPEFEEVVVRVFVPDIRRESCTKRINMSSSSLLSKGRTKLMNKYRMLAEETKARDYIAEQDLD